MYKSSDLAQILKKFETLFGVFLSVCIIMISLLVSLSLKCMARLAGQFLAPAEGFGLWPCLFFSFYAFSSPFYSFFMINSALSNCKEKKK